MDISGRFEICILADGLLTKFKKHGESSAVMAKKFMLFGDPKQSFTLEETKQLQPFPISRAITNALDKFPTHPLHTEEMSLSLTLGILFALLKRCYPFGSGPVTIRIYVPFWFSYFHRQEIMNFIRLADMRPDNVELINQNAAVVATWTRVIAGEVAAVISKWDRIIEVSIYLCNNEVVDLIGYDVCDSGILEWKNKWNIVKESFSRAFTMAINKNNAPIKVLVVYSNITNVNNFHMWLKAEHCVDGKNIIEYKDSMFFLPEVLTNGSNVILRCCLPFKIHTTLENAKMWPKTPFQSYFNTTPKIDPFDFNWNRGKDTLSYKVPVKSSSNIKHLYIYEQWYKGVKTLIGSVDSKELCIEQDESLNLLVDTNGCFSLVTANGTPLNIKDKLEYIGKRLTDDEVDDLRQKILRLIK